MLVSQATVVRAAPRARPSPGGARDRAGAPPVRAPGALAPTRIEPAAEGGATVRPTLGIALAACLVRRYDAATTRGSDEAMAALRAVLTDVVDCLKRQALSEAHVQTVVDGLLREDGSPWRVVSRGAAAAPPCAPEAAAHLARLRGWCARAYADDAWW